MNDIYRKRLDTLQDTLSRNGFDACLIMQEENRRYLSGFTGEDNSVDESAGALLIGPKGLILATDSRFELHAIHEAPLFDVHVYKTGLDKDLPELLDRVGASRVAFEETRVSVGRFNAFAAALKKSGSTAELVAHEDMTAPMRAIKSADEIQTMREALAIAEAAFSAVKANLTPGLTEKAIAWEMEKEMRSRGADGLSFPTIVASGPNAALPHAVPGDRKVAPGEPLLIDWGSRYNGYCSDSTRTVVLGSPCDTFKRVFDTLFEAQARAIDAICDGASGKTVDAVARGFIEQTFPDGFGHGLGHGVGLEIHEAPRLSYLKDHTLKAGMVVTVEPGIYLPEWGGIRLENMVLVTENGAEVLNTLDYRDHIVAI
ncbi:M24 family metallopeptidase [Desulfoluna spongiiphila]|uniref:Xaa-Pro aminopeptidase n=1 Tax=Desulfoluna spongiiphila TaxID=419481 RepID=A0A1G5HRF0_9BACT|nr:Xaa-Pro peptidase family protein [Desulfoluna spongiiphila]SCY66445.1 Xaa-Pro aminopeptidase [Desulfoluna spongiiphila]